MHKWLPNLVAKFWLPNLVLYQTDKNTSVHYGRNGLKFGTLLYPDYHSLKLTIYFALSGSLSLWCQIIHKLVLSWGGNKRNIHFFIRMSDLHAIPITNITHSAGYTVEMGVSAGVLTHITLVNNHTAYMHICLQGISCVCIKNYPPEIMQPSSSTCATIVSAENQNGATIIKATFFFCHYSILHENWCLLYWYKISRWYDEKLLSCCRVKICELTNKQGVSQCMAKEILVKNIPLAQENFLIMSPFFITRVASWGPDRRKWLFSEVRGGIWTPHLPVLIKISADKRPLNQLTVKNLFFSLFIKTFCL